ncbi:hypothetical protein SB912_26855, partial [Pantoea sp. SIMBA_072]
MSFSLTQMILISAAYLMVLFGVAWISERGAFTQPMQILTAQVYLSDIDHSIGPTWIVPGSHRAAR